MEKLGSHSMKDLVSPKLVSRQSDLNLVEAFKIHGEKNQKESNTSVIPTCLGVRSNDGGLVIESPSVSLSKSSDSPLIIIDEKNSEIDSPC